MRHMGRRIHVSATIDPPNATINQQYVTYEEEDTCASYGEEDTCQCYHRPSKRHDLHAEYSTLKER